MEIYEWGTDKEKDKHLVACICPTCKRTPIFDDREEETICPNCGNQENFTIHPSSYLPFKPSKEMVCGI